MGGEHSVRYMGIILSVLSIIWGNIIQYFGKDFSSFYISKYFSYHHCTLAGRTDCNNIYEIKKDQARAEWAKLRVI